MSGSLFGHGTTTDSPVSPLFVKTEAVLEALQDAGSSTGRSSPSSTTAQRAKAG